MIKNKLQFLQQLLIIVLLVNMCGCKLILPPPPPLIDDLSIPMEIDTTFYWVKDKPLLNKLQEDNKGIYMTLEEVKKKFCIKHGTIHIKERDIPTYYRIYYNFNDQDVVRCDLFDRILDNGSESSECSDLDWKVISYDYQGNIKKISFDYIEQNLRFQKGGSGMYKDFGCYTVRDTLPYMRKEDEDIEWKQNNCYDENGLWQSSDRYNINDSLSIRERFMSYLKEEGEIKNNYKVGRWKYYDKEGNVIREKDYNLKDKVDIRFPYCIFNKKEPCFCDE